MRAACARVALKIAVEVRALIVAVGPPDIQGWIDKIDCSAGAQRVFGTAGKGRLAKGYDGDLTIVDMKEKKEITDAMMANKSGWTPFAGMTVTGWPKATIIRGNIVMRDDEVVAEGLGEPVRFMETLQPEG